MDLPTYAEWQDLPGKSARKEILITLRRVFDDKDIREFWELKPQTWYNLLNRYEIGGKRGQTPRNEIDDRPHRKDKEPTEPTGKPSGRSARKCSIEGCDEPHVAKGFCRKHYFQQKSKQPQPEQQEEPQREEVEDRIPSDRRWPRTNVIEADYTVIQSPVMEDEAIKRLVDRHHEQQENEYAKQTARQPIVPTSDLELPFPTIKGTPEQLRKQFEAVALFLEGLENEETRFEIRLAVVKA